MMMMILIRQPEPEFQFSYFQARVLAGTPDFLLRVVVSVLTLIQNPFPLSSPQLGLHIHSKSLLSVSAEVMSKSPSMVLSFTLII